MEQKYKNPLKFHPSESDWAIVKHIEDPVPMLARIIFWLLFLFLCSSIFILFYFKIPEVTTLRGEIDYKTPLSRIYSSVTGVVKDVYVTSGQEVELEQDLIKIVDLENDNEIIFQASEKGEVLMEKPLLNTVVDFKEEIISIRPAGSELVVKAKFPIYEEYLKFKNTKYQKIIINIGGQEFHVKTKKNLNDLSWESGVVLEHSSIKYERIKEFTGRKVTVQIIYKEISLMRVLINHILGLT